MTDLKAWLDVLAPLAVILTAITGIAAAVFVSLQVAHMKRAREVDTFLRILEAGNREPLCSAANWVKYEMPSDLSYDQARRDRNIWLRISAVEHHFEMLGVLVERGYLSRDLVFDQMGAWIAGSWAKLQPVIGAHRAAQHAPTHGENFELLAKSYAEWAKSNPAKLEDRSRTTSEAIRDYYRRVLPNKGLQPTARKKRGRRG
jgi:hypothetical protein